MMPVEQNHYEFLGVEPEASPEEIARAVAKLREMWAPGSLALYSLVDREEHKALLDRLEEAAVVLGDARARAAYDERHGIGRRLPPAPPKPRPGPAKQLPLPEIVEAVDGAPAWPNASAGPAEAAPVVEPAPVAAVAGSGAVVAEPEPPPAVPVAADSAVGAEAAPEEAGPVAVAAEPVARPEVPSAGDPVATPGSAPVEAGEAAGPAPELAAASRTAAPEAPAVDAPDDDGIDIDLDDFEEPAGDGISPAGPRALAAALDRLTVPAPKAPAPPVELPPMPELGPDTEYTGELLRRIREARGVGLRELATRTRITMGHLENLEAEAYGNLPERVYLRGILTAYARELKVDGARLAETYLARWAARRR